MAFALLLFMTFASMATVGATAIAWHLKGPRVALLIGTALLGAFVILGISVALLIRAGLTGSL